jgi:hypothetical protein
VFSGVLICFLRINLKKHKIFSVSKHYILTIRFYAGKIGTGILMLLTLGGFGIWAIIDLVVIACGSFKDDKGLLIKN